MTLLELIDAYATITENDGYNNTPDSRESEVARAAVVAALSGLERDAERYRWLRREAEKGLLEGDVAIGQWDHIEPGKHDAAIDLAIGEQK